MRCSNRSVDVGMPTLVRPTRELRAASWHASTPDIPSSHRDSSTRNCAPPRFRPRARQGPAIAFDYLGDIGTVDETQLGQLTGLAVTTIRAGLPARPTTGAT